MSVQAPGKSSAKRRGKQISFFGESTATIRPGPPRHRTNGMLRGEAEVLGGLADPQPPAGPEAPVSSGQCQSVATSDPGTGPESGVAADSNSTAPPNWATSILVDRLPAKGGLIWQTAGQAGSWTQSAAPFCAGGGAVGIADSGALGPFPHPLVKQGARTQLSHQSLQRQQENAVSVSQLDLFGDAIKQIAEKAQLAKKQAMAKQQSLAELRKQQLQIQLQHQQSQQTQLQQTQLQHQHQQTQHQQTQLQHQHQQTQHQQTQLQHQHQQTQLQHQQSQQTQLQQTQQTQHQQTQLQHQQSQQTQLQQTQLQHQHQHQQSQQTQLQHQQSQQTQHQQSQLQHQHQQTQLQQTQLQHQQTQHQQTQHQQTQLQHQQHQEQQHQQQQQSNEALPHHQFFQFSYSQSQKQDLPPNAVLSMFHQAHQPSLLPLYSHQAQQHIFQQFFPHQQPPQSLGLQRVQTGQGPDPSMHHIAPAAPQFQQPSEAPVSKGLQRSTVGYKPERPSLQMAAEFQAPLAKRAQCSFKERKTKPAPFEPQRLGNATGTADSASQHWPQAYGPELQKLLNVPPSHGGCNPLKLFQMDLLQSKSGQGHAQANEKGTWCPREHEMTQLSQDGRKAAQVPAQEPASDVEGAADSVIQSTAGKDRTSNKTNGLQPQHASADPLANWNSSAETRGNDSQEERKRAAAGHSKVAGVTAESAAPRGRLNDGCLVPLVIPVSVPVRKMDSVTTNPDQRGDSQRSASSELSPSLTTNRKRRLSCGSGAEPSVQEDDGSRGQAKLTAKLKRRPRPEPLFIPPKPLNHVSVITYPPGALYQSNLRSPVRLLDHPMDRNFQPPPYTPPPILSPMREGSGLYFKAFLSASTNTSQPATPRSTPKTGLSRSNSADTPPPVLSLMNEATPASIEPRINIGAQFQAVIPWLRDRSLAALDANHADLVFKPREGQKTNRLNQQRVESLMTLACSNVLPGGGTNQELTLHCLHASKGNILTALNMLLIKRSPRGRSRALTDYHYAGSDKWLPAEKMLFNKGLTAHKKDFFLVQKLVKTKTVAQCVEFYYTYKKQVKIGRNGALIFGDICTNNAKTVDEPVTIDRKDSLPRKARMPFTAEIKKELEGEDEEEEEEEEEDEEEEEEEEEEDMSNPKKSVLIQAKVTRTERDPAAPHGDDQRKSHDPTYRCSYRPRRPAVTPAAPGAPTRSERVQAGASAKHAKQSQENIFPCKKCGKVFYKVKSRSAHMKSHSVQEKKQREAELRSRVAAEEERAKGHEEYDDYYYYYQDM
uniref:mitotic deacetylase-associated SANT domain protein-like n=1 Tax=Pristiophorus japonicus TaxID=55135 RepID=UPI00398F4246